MGFCVWVCGHERSTRRSQKKVPLDLKLQAFELLDEGAGNQT